MLGNGTPSRTITGCATGLDLPLGIARDRSGNLYVANFGANTISVYAVGASGNVAPLRTIAGPHTGLSSPNGVALDAAGNLYVATWPASILVYGADATGDAAPARSIAGPSTGLTLPRGIAVDTDGRIYVANTGYSYGADGRITIYPPGASGNQRPTATIAGYATGPSYPQGIALGPQGRLYVADTEYPIGEIRVYAPDTTGTFAPTATISGGNTGLADFIEGIAVDGLGRVYVTSGSVILIFAPNATGNTAPLARIAGSSTGFNGPTYLTF